VAARQRGDRRSTPARNPVGGETQTSFQVDQLPAGKLRFLQHPPPAVTKHPVHAPRQIQMTKIKLFQNQRSRAVQLNDPIDDPVDATIETSSGRRHAHCQYARFPQKWAAYHRSQNPR